MSAIKTERHDMIKEKKTLREHFIDYSTSVSEVAEYTGVSYNALSNWYNSEKKAGLLELILLGMKYKKQGGK